MNSNKLSVIVQYIYLFYFFFTWNYLYLYVNLELIYSILSYLFQDLILLVQELFHLNLHSLKPNSAPKR